MGLKVGNDTIARCSMVKEFYYEIIWKAERNYPSGTLIELRSDRSRSFQEWKFIKINMDGADIIWRCKINPSVSEYRKNPDRVILRANIKYGIKMGSELKIKMWLVPSIYAGTSQLLSLWIKDVKNNFLQEQPDREYKPETDSTLELALMAASVDRISIYARPMSNKDGFVRVVIIPEDKFGNPSVFKNPVKMELEWEGTKKSIVIKRASAITIKEPAFIGRARLYIPLRSLALDENIQNGAWNDDFVMVTGNPVWNREQVDLLAVFGEFHWHTDISVDGQRSIGEALRSAKDYLNMDFTAPSDHNPKGRDWRDTVKALQDTNANDDFITLFGWESGGDRGHENYYFMNPWHPLICDGRAGVKGGNPNDLKDTLRQYNKFFAVPHHTNAMAETRKIEDDSPYWHPYPFEEPEKYQRLIEIFQTRGNQERNTYTDVWRGWHQNNGSSVQDALDMGYKLGFTGGTDNHNGWPGRAYTKHEGGGIHSPKSVILTGAWVKEKTRKGVFNALYNRNTWAVWDTRAILLFSINRSLMGEEITVKIGQELTAWIGLSAEAPIQSLEIISQVGTVYALSLENPDIDMEIPLGSIDKEMETYFYVRILLRNGGLVYASPVFVKVKKRLFDNIIVREDDDPVINAKDLLRDELINDGKIKSDSALSPFRNPITEEAVKMEEDNDPLTQLTYIEKITNNMPVKKMFDKFIGREEEPEEIEEEEAVETEHMVNELDDVPHPEDEELSDKSEITEDIMEDEERYVKSEIIEDSMKEEERYDKPEIIEESMEDEERYVKSEIIEDSIEEEQSDKSEIIEDNMEDEDSIYDESSYEDDKDYRSDDYVSEDYEPISNEKLKDNDETNSTDFKPDKKDDEQ